VTALPLEHDNRLQQFLRQFLVFLLKDKDAPISMIHAVRRRNSYV